MQRTLGLIPAQEGKEKCPLSNACMYHHEPAPLKYMPMSLCAYAFLSGLREGPLLSLILRKACKPRHIVF